VKPDSADNKFIAHFFNRFPADIDADLKKQIVHGIPQEIVSLDQDDK
jgi:hypothetical protein